MRIESLRLLCVQPSAFLHKPPLIPQLLPEAAVLHFVYRDRVVAVKLSNNNYGLITAYDNDYVWIADPAKGEVYSMTQTAAEKLFEQNGKVYYSYMD